MAGELLSSVEGFLEKDIHPTVIVNAYFKALEEIVKITETLGVNTLISEFEMKAVVNILNFRIKLILRRMKICKKL